MRIIVLDGYTENPGDLSWEGLEKLGELTVYDRTAYAEDPLIAQRIGEAEIVVTNKTPVSRTTLERCPNVKLIAVLATGYNVVDCAAARERGIPVVNVPAYGTASVSQYSIALLLELCHHIGHHSDTVHAGRWAGGADWCYWDYPMVELAGKTMGIIGFGRIGRAEGAIARALGMEVLAVDPYPTDEGRAIGTYVELNELLERSDVVSLHCNLTPENTGLINRDTIAKMKPGALLINNARGQLLHEADVAEALNSGKLGGAAVDVVSTEPIRPDNPLLKAKNCLITPHISWAARESRRRIMDATVENVKAFLAGHPRNVVNGL
ncbi:MAG: D-2-hydroxyacid dehydrogenase [Oscillospiraceae bacterium]|nr:D-2-hydroxyacid dehydrogenase [Oscillospiraceae bacterium]